MTWESVLNFEQLYDVASGKYLMDAQCLAHKKHSLSVFRFEIRHAADRPQTVLWSYTLRRTPSPGES